MGAAQAIRRPHLCDMEVPRMAKKIVPQEDCIFCAKNPCRCGQEDDKANSKE